MVQKYLRSLFVLTVFIVGMLVGAAMPSAHAAITANKILTSLPDMPWEMFLVAPGPTGDATFRCARVDPTDIDTYECAPAPGLPE